MESKSQKKINYLIFHKFSSIPPDLTILIYYI